MARSSRHVFALLRDVEVPGAHERPMESTKGRSDALLSLFEELIKLTHDLHARSEAVRENAHLLTEQSRKIRADARNLRQQCSVAARRHSLFMRGTRTRT
jgi:hypothetical protein